MSEDLKQFCDALPLQDKLAVRDYLSGRIAVARSGVVPKSPVRCFLLLGEIAEVMGMKTISFTSREANHVWARTMVAYQMTMEGYTATEIGNQLNKDHASVTHMKQKMQGVFQLPQAYLDIIDIWDRFQKRINHDI